MVKSATELYTVPLKRKSFTLGDVEIPFKPGLLSTISYIQENTSKKTLRDLGPRLGAVTRNTDKILALLVAFAQCEWYESKGEELALHPTIVETYNRAFKEATVTDPTPEPTTAEATTPKARAGTRPYCRSLIDAGERDEQVLLAAVKEKYPDKPFKLGDVRGCLRNAGILAWTSRKGAKKQASAEA